ncbi:TetR/AcrR family transcriptional regulator [Flavobacterium sp. RSB2_4_14]|uniref:TetR/AcrR family transcriptional regulator n=1 Tax=Flavobacterium sp. RSB2_4_14 TaxID=3447665 RepID=UPI003F307ABF
MTEFNDKQIEILQVAEKLFAEVGFDGTSIRDIAKVANINIAMISYYFGSKEKLLEALVLYRISGMSLQLETLNQENISPIEKIERLITYYIQQINTNRCIYQILHFELSSKKREINLDAFTTVKNNNLKLLENIVKEGQAQGIFKSNINVVLIPPLIIGSLIHIHMNKKYYQELLELKNEADYENYILTELTQHIQKTIKALLVYEN